MIRISSSRHAALAVLAIAALAFTLACNTGGGAPSPETPDAVASMLDATGKAVGTASLYATSGGVRIHLSVAGLAPGVHGVHIHTVGKCDGAAFTTAGGHFNPGAMKHGMQAQGGPHAGDLPNFTVAAGDSARYDATTTRVALDAGATGLFDADGSAIVIHAAADDNMTDPAGNSGARIVCGIVRAGSIR